MFDYVIYIYISELYPFSVYAVRGENKRYSFCTTKLSVSELLDLPSVEFNPMLNFDIPKYVDGLAIFAASDSAVWHPIHITPTTPMGEKIAERLKSSNDKKGVIGILEFEYGHKFIVNGAEKYNQIINSAESMNEEVPVVFMNTSVIETGAE